MTRIERELREAMARGAAAFPDNPYRLDQVMRRTGRRRRSDHVLRWGLAALVVLPVVGWRVIAMRPSPPTATAALSCAGGELALRDSRVSVGEGGVRFEVTNNATEPVTVSAGPQVALVPPGRTVIEMALPPGRTTLTCDGGQAGRPAVIDVVDPGHLYVDDRLSCDPYAARGLVESPSVEVGDPVELTGRALGDLLPARATVESAGYPGAPARTIRVRSGGTIIAVAVWHRLPARGTWMLDRLSACGPASRPPSYPA